MHHDVAASLVDPAVPRATLKQEGCGMTDKTTIEINVDTFSEGESYFVRTEIEARSVNISGPLPNLEAAQGLKARQLANREKVSAALEEHLRRASSTLPAGS
jgi:hypothetical protein